MSTCEYLRAIGRQAELVPNRIAFENSEGERITYAELWRASDALACWIQADASIPEKAPLVVYGHKSPLMLVCFLACSKSGHSYVPIDTVYPLERVANIADQVAPTVVFDTVGALASLSDGSLAHPCHGPEEIRSAAAGDASRVGELRGIEQDDPFYLLFTSGSTGTPKGVVVSCDCVDGFYRWMTSDYAFEEDAPESPDGLERGGRIWFNRTPFSFDVSLTDMACGLTRGDTSYALESAADTSVAKTFEALATSQATDWVSTPSFAEQCLADKSFGAALMPRLHRVLLAGETLRPETVRQLKERFPGLHVYNGYGPTESTDLVTLCEITDDMLEGDRALPIGYAKPGTDLYVVNPETLELVPRGTAGEMYIVGDTVARGYWKRPEQTEAAFNSCPAELAAGRRAYRTGDEVTMAEDGLVYFHGRLDFQVKLHGFRIELGDVESMLCTIPDVHMACVLPVMRDGRISHLTAIVVPSDPEAPRGFALTKKIKQQARQTLPNYMIPSSFKYIDNMPLNPNGKADRKALAALLG